MSAMSLFLTTSISQRSCVSADPLLCEDETSALRIRPRPTRVRTRGNAHHTANALVGIRGLFSQGLHKGESGGDDNRQGLRRHAANTV
ncbi:hypothetical protein EJ05DRAFT_282490 [Pseudovirgaria hyperparasitica]|uniref:Uncharacterized protein n=1 Tax=Pseudovirgaria hyperparasitica TaxID=470096 RepID=A0A6A6WFJ9_9PEZI|nr:uncharacterized protein EJ05DRAFT_282490 [Pseudovirgaria hyperparasitica]KAF2760367.1 hypothetical protein EJ05DRAFT_282490 [Pseudovirgaria hyperparasitica]